MSDAEGTTTALGDYDAAVAAYVAAGGEESVQRVITALFSLTRKLDQWYNRQLADLDLSHGEWAVMVRLARSRGAAVTPTALADAAGVAPSSMTHRLDRMCARGLVARMPDPDNRTRVQVTLTKEGWALFSAAVREANVVESDVLAPLSTRQRDEMGRLLEHVIARLDELDPS